jgi:7-cyano-7-deazaguanine synthase in queuosine biosynthesis
MKSVIVMMSGGLDSRIMYQWALHHDYKPFPVFVEMGLSKPVNYDYIALRRMFDKGDFHVANIPWGQFEVAGDDIIPSRNLLLALVGAQFGSRVWIGALDGEQFADNYDKTAKFFTLATDLLSHTQARFSPGGVVVESPFLWMTKAEIIRWALNEAKMSLTDLMQTHSCYNSSAAGKEKCGHCLACFKRWAAFTLNGVEEYGHASRPWESEYAKEQAARLLDDPLARTIESPARVEEFHRLVEIMGGRPC